MHRSGFPSPSPSSGYGQGQYAPQAVTAWMPQAHDGFLDSFPSPAYSEPEIPFQVDSIIPQPGGEYSPPVLSGHHMFSPERELPRNHLIPRNFEYGSNDRFHEQPNRGHAPHEYCVSSPPSEFEHSSPFFIGHPNWHSPNDQNQLITPPQIPYNGEHVSFDSPSPFFIGGGGRHNFNSPQFSFNGYRPRFDSQQIPYNGHNASFNSSQQCNTRGPRHKFQFTSANKNMNSLSRSMKAKGPPPNRRNTYPIDARNSVNIVPYRNPSVVTPSSKPRPPPPELPSKLYHYTNEEGKDGILSDKYLRPKPQAGYSTGKGTSARFGKGIYFTHLPPDTPTKDILINNYGSSSISLMHQSPRTEFCFEFDTSNLHERLDYVEDESCFNTNNERRRYIWIFKSDKLHIVGSQGFYYERILDGFDKKPKEIRKNVWNFLETNSDSDSEL